MISLILHKRAFFDKPSAKGEKCIISTLKKPPPLA
jgi:hypothetical protein